MPELTSYQIRCISLRNKWRHTKAIEDGAFSKTDSVCSLGRPELWASPPMLLPNHFSVPLELSQRHRTCRKARCLRGQERGKGGWRVRWNLLAGKDFEFFDESQLHRFSLRPVSYFRESKPLSFIIEWKFLVCFLLGGQLSPELVKRGDYTSPLGKASSLIALSTTE